MFVTFNIWLIILGAMIAYVILRIMKYSKEESIVMVLFYFILVLGMSNVDRWVK